VGSVLLIVAVALGTTGLTLDDALREARAANATLPAARADATQAEAKAREAKAQLYPHVELDGELLLAKPDRYSESHALAKVLGAMTVFDGGRRRAELRAALAGLESTTSGVRKAEADLSLEVRTRFDELSELDEELALRRAALEHLGRYLSALEQRRAGGEAVGADWLKTRTQVLGDSADLESLGRERSTAAHEFNELLGREPETELALAPLTDESAAHEPSARPWERTSDVAQAMAEASAAQEALAGANSERFPTLEARAELGGVKPLFGSALDAADLPTAPGDGFGGALGLSLSLPLFDFGAIRARQDQARSALDKAQAELRLALRDAHLSWSNAYADLDSLARELALRTEAAPVAKDAYLAAEARYRGGVGTGLEVLEAHNAWIDAEVKVLQTRQALRDARARLLRWEGR
jgi:outer membrane protein TolC